MKKFILWLLFLLFITCGVICIRLVILEEGLAQKIKLLEKISIVEHKKLIKCYYGKVEKNYAPLYEKAIALLKKNLTKSQIDFVDDGFHFFGKYDFRGYRITNKIPFLKNELKKMQEIDSLSQPIYHIIDQIPPNNKCRFSINAELVPLHLNGINRLAKLVLIRMVLAIKNNRLSLALQCFHNSISFINAINEEPSLCAPMDLHSFQKKILICFSLLLNFKNITKKQECYIAKGIQSIHAINFKLYVDSTICARVEEWKTRRSIDIFTSKYDRILGTNIKNAIGVFGVWEEVINIENSNLSHKDKFLQMMDSKFAPYFLGINIPMQFFAYVVAYNEAILLMKTSLALQKYYRKNNKYPQKLQALVNNKYLYSLPLHVYTKTPFIYTTSKNGYELANFNISFCIGTMEFIPKIELIIENKK